MDIDPKLKDRMKQKKLEDLQQKYFNAYMDHVALKAAGNDTEAEKMKEVMEALEKAYEAVEAM